jgi:glucosamine--fructose-6-phosphate aminotransferase (isomerizing)
VAGDIAVVHNGIIENYLELKKFLVKKGARFQSETDTEVVAHLIDYYYREGGDYLGAVRRALKEIEGSYALVILNRREGNLLLGARKESPLVIGAGAGEMFIASDFPAFLAHTNRVQFLHDQELAVVKSGGCEIQNLEGELIPRPVEVINWTPAMAEKGGFKHFMQKEIFEQPQAFINTVRGNVSASTGKILIPDMGISPDILKKIRQIHIVACGTSWHAALVGKFLLEKFLAIPVNVDYASEFRYRDPLLDDKSLLILISQSGETADTLAALKEGKAKGAWTLSICNVVGSSLTRETHGTIYTYAGPEIGVASTKAFITQLGILYLLTLYWGDLLGRIAADFMRGEIQALLNLPRRMKEVLKMDGQLALMAKKYSNAENFLYLGRGITYPIALEGALKLKEISYIHAEGYPAGEMKHGPIALIDEHMPVVFVMPTGDLLGKLRNNMEEVKARGGKIITVAPEGTPQIEALSDDRITIPGTSENLLPILTVIPLQLLAYHIAVIRGTDVDQPRNLAKSVTVE